MVKLTNNQKKERKDSVKAFAIKYGSNDLTDNQKKERIKKVIGSEYSKLKIFKTSGVELFKGSDIPEDILSNIDKYPNDPYAQDHDSKVLDINVESDGTLTMKGIKIDGNENDPGRRGVWSQESISDQDLARMEVKQFKDGKLKKVADRTKSIHIDNGDFDAMLDDENLDTGNDPKNGY